MAEFGVLHQLITPAGTITFNDYESDTYYKLDSKDGMAATVRGSFKNRPGHHGLRPGNRLKSGVFPVLRGRFIHDGPSTQETMRRELSTVAESIMNETGTLRWQPSDADGEWRWLPVQLNEPGIQVTGDLIKEFQVPLLSRTPYVFGSSHEAETGTYSAGAGLTFPLTFPFTFDPAGGFVTVVNDGDLETYPTYRIHGPILRPVIENITTGDLIVFRSDFMVEAGTYVEIDTWEETVYLGGDETEPRDGQVESTMSEYAPLPRGENQLRLIGLTGTPGVTKLETFWDDTHG